MTKEIFQNRESLQVDSEYDNIVEVLSFVQISVFFHKLDLQLSECGGQVWLLLWQN